MASGLTSTSLRIPTPGACTSAGWLLFSRVVHLSLAVWGPGTHSASCWGVQRTRDERSPGSRLHHGDVWVSGPNGSPVQVEAQRDTDPQVRARDVPAMRCPGLSSAMLFPGSGAESGGHAGARARARSTQVAPPRAN
eukprot:2281240-Rhodomonas_salina.2